MASRPQVAAFSPPVQQIALRIGVLALLLAIAGFSTLAKNSQYFAKSNPAHYINISSKIKVTAQPTLLERTPLRPVAKSVAIRPELRIQRVVRAETPPLPSIAVTVSLQFRSPPGGHV
jgi:hypothetical protein